MDIKTITELLLELTPLVSKFWLPVFGEKKISDSLNRNKFFYFDDRILLFALKKYGKRNQTK